MYYQFETVTILAGKYKGQTGVILAFRITFIPTLYEIAVNNGKVIALFENEIALTGGKEDEKVECSYGYY